MAQIARDAHGIPHITGTNVLDVAYGQGQACAADRSWQLEWLRRRATGTTSQITDAAVAGEWDAFSRHARVLDTAQRAYAALGEPARAFVNAYVEGLNSGWRDAPEFDDVGIEPEPWPAWMPLATFHAQHVLFANVGEILWQRRLAEVLGDDAGWLNREEDPTHQGSNAWGVGGARTASGYPLIAGDPHRTIETPGVYHQVRLVCADADDEFDVAGFSFAGVPGVQHFAHAGEVAWAITNASADYQSATPDPQAPFGFRLGNASTDLGELGFDALLPLLRARRVDDVSAALACWVEPVNNVVIADRAGALRYQIAGRVPAGNGWYEDRHQVDLPAEGQVVTANERRGPESARIGTRFAAPHRARRIAALLDGRTGLTAADFSAIHNDAWLATVEPLASLVPGAFDDFDAVMAADSVHAGRFAAYRAALVQRVAAAEVFAPLLEPCPHGALFAPWFSLVHRVGLALPTWVGRENPFGLDLRVLAVEALADVDALPAPSWGQSHTFAPVHALANRSAGFDPGVPALPLDGDTDCVRCTASEPALADACSRGSVARYIWDLADRSAGGWVVPGGASGDPRSPHHHDQTTAWAAGTLVEI